MQPEPIEISTSYTKSPAEGQPVLTSQHGFHSPDLRQHDTRSDQQGVSTECSPSPGARDAFIDNDSAPAEPLLGVNVEVARDNHTSSSVYRIAEHENALVSLPQKKEFEGPYFRVTKSGTTLNGPRLESLPNGTAVLKCLIGAMLIASRGANPHSLSPACCITLGGLPRVASLL
jgi:hypothetical protein